MTRSPLRLALTFLLALLAAPAPAAPPRISWGQPFPEPDPDLPEGFTDTTVATGLTALTALAVAPDGRVFVCEQTGSLRVIKDDQLLPDPFLTVPVDDYWERGLIGVTLHPDFPRTPYVYVCYVAKAPYTHHRVSRFTAAGDRAVPGSELILLEGDDQKKWGGTKPGGHQGGALHFGADGKLYVAIGDLTAGSPSQRLDDLHGKLLRINPDGSIPDDNPFAAKARGKYRAIWALGLRNPFAFAVQPGTGRIFINDVGLTRIEEVNEGVAGANYGWPDSEGPTTKPGHRNPVHCYDRTVGRSIAGGTFYNPPAVQFPPKYVGKYFFLDFMDPWVRVLDPDRPAQAEVFATGLAGPVDIATAPDGSLYYLNRREWTVGEKNFRPGTGSVHRIRYGAAPGVPHITEQPADVTAVAGQAATLRVAATGDGLRYRWFRNGTVVPGAAIAVLTLPDASLDDDGAEFRCEVSNATGRSRTRRAELRVRRSVARPGAPVLNIAAAPAGPPPVLSRTGVFRSVADLTPAAGILPYTLNAPAWADGATVRRWFGLPGDAAVGFRPTGEWSYPAGTVFVQHFESEGRRLETRLLVVTRHNDGYGVTYRWRPDQSDADLLTGGLTTSERFDTPHGPRSLYWTYPGPGDCRTCHSATAGFVLGVNARQLPGDQLRRWNDLGLFTRTLTDAEIDRPAKLVPASDRSAPLEHRVRSYLDANCAHCHRPGGARGLFDARFDTPLARQGLINGELAAADLGDPGARVIVPRDANRSVLFARMYRRGDTLAMPPLATHLPDEAALAAVAEWIGTLPPEPAKPARKPKNQEIGAPKNQGANAPRSPGSATGRFVRLAWYEPGIENGNPPTNRHGRFRVNAPEAVLHPSYGGRPEARSSGMLQIKQELDPRALAAAELYLELWGGHPGTANKRVTLNGRGTYRLGPDGPEPHCTHLNPTIPLTLTDLVNGHNALQFACDRGTTFWGHFIVEHACLRAVLPDGHADVKQTGLTGFRAAVQAQPAGETIALSLDLTPDQAAKVAAVEYHGHYRGYAENGLTAQPGWHGFTKNRQPTAILGRATEPPFRVTWDVSMLPAQDDMAVRAVVRFKDAPDLVYEAPAHDALRTPERNGVAVRLITAPDLPVPFWSRANRTQGCTVPLDLDPATIERAELHVVTWDGGAGTVRNYFTLNGRGLNVAGTGKHDVIYKVMPIDPKWLKRGANRIELRSDTDHHGIEVLWPGPTLVVRYREE